jgi:hypothetical protein
MEVVGGDAKDVGTAPVEIGGRAVGKGRPDDMRNSLEDRPPPFFLG